VGLSGYIWAGVLSSTASGYAPAGMGLVPASGAVAARTRSAPAALAAGNEVAASIPFTDGGEGRDQSAGAHLSASGAGGRTVGLVDRAEYFKARVTILAPILVQWHLHTS